MRLQSVRRSAVRQAVRQQGIECMWWVEGVGGGSCGLRGSSIGALAFLAACPGIGKDRRI